MTKFGIARVTPLNAHEFQSSREAVTAVSAFASETPYEWDYDIRSNGEGWYVSARCVSEGVRFSGCLAPILDGAE